MANEASDETTPGTTLFHVTGELTIEEVLEAPNAREAVLRFLTANPEAEATHVGSREIIGLDADSGAVILEGDEYHQIPEHGYKLIKAVDGEGENELVFEPYNEEYSE